MDNGGRRRLRWLGVPLVAVGVSLACCGACVGVPCVSTGLRYGMWLDQCPAGDLRLNAEINAHGLLRGEDDGWIWVNPSARYLQGDGAYAWVDRSPLYRGRSVAIALRDPAGAEVPLTIVEQDDTGYGVGFRVELPELPDGDYTLAATVVAPFETVEVTAPLALYAPAIVHAISDRPLYKPGQDVLLRSVVFRRTDLSPLDQRPGTWRILAPDGSEMMVEKDQAGVYGVADTSFPLDDRAAVGTWRAVYRSGDVEDTVSFDVRPFRLPRFTVSATPSQTWYRRGDELIVEGTASYASGAPVKDAPVKVALQAASGRWSPPLDWEGPRQVTTDAWGRFRVSYGAVPVDLIERAELSVVAAVTDPAGETLTGGGRVVLSELPLQIEAVTELGDGLVGGFNNRAYLRVTRPDGVPVPEAEVAVTPWWDATADAKLGTTDVDGVAAMQLDPGEPVTVVQDAPPYRARPLRPASPSLSSAREVGEGREPDLDERRALDRLHPGVAACGDYAVGGGSARVAVRVDASGAVRKVFAGESRVDRCVADVMRGGRFPSGDERTFVFDWQVPDSLRPSLSGSVDVAYGSGNDAVGAIGDAAVAARRCLERGVGQDGDDVVAVHWSVERGQRAISVAFGDADGAGLSPSALACVRGAFSGLSIDDAADADVVGTASFDLSVPTQGGGRPSSLTSTGYDLRVSAVVDGEPSDGRLILGVGQVPALRIRPSETLLHPGETVEFELIRGPAFYGELPEEVHLYEGGLHLAKAKVDPKTRKASFEIPADRSGFLYVQHGDARAVVWVAPKETLAVALSTDKVAYRPGEEAHLTVSTKVAGQGAPAGVGLIGVDSKLGDLMPLPGPQEYGRVTVRETADKPAFGAFDPRALVLGEVRGDSAARAAVLRLTGLPMDAAGDNAASAYASTVDNDTEVLTTSFYRALIAASDAVRGWESAAPAGDQLTHAKMRELWDASLAKLRSDGTPAVDAYGRELRLNLLPYDLLVQVDPRNHASDATRLPEDLTDWPQWVAAEVR